MWEKGGWGKCVDHVYRRHWKWSVNHTWWTLHRHLGCNSIATPLSSKPVDSWLIFYRCIWVGQHYADNQPIVDQVSTEYWLGCWWTVNQDIDQGYQSKELDHGCLNYTSSITFKLKCFPVGIYCSLENLNIDVKNFLLVYNKLPYLIPYLLISKS